MTERPQNVRSAISLERSYPNGSDYYDRLIPEARTEDNQLANRSYRGSHRAGGVPDADEQYAAEQRSSRIGRHHAEHREDYLNRS